MENGEISENVQSSNQSLNEVQMENSLNTEVNCFQQITPTKILRQITPKSKKIRSLRVTIAKLKRRLISNRNVKRNFSIPYILEILKNKLPYRQYVYVASQIRHYERSPYGRRWTLHDKAFALSVYLKSPSAYQALCRHLNLPTVRTLRQSMSGIGSAPGFCPVLFESIKNSAKKMTMLEKFCTLSFDEIYIKSALHYNQHLDWVSGYECFDINNNTSNKLATNALVFMIRGLSKSWKQPIGYFFSSHSTPASMLKKLLFQAFEKILQADLKLVAIVCDQAPNNQRLYSDLNISAHSPFINYNGSKIFALYDTTFIEICEE